MKPADQPTKAEPPRWMPTRGTALKIAGWYAVLGALWIFFSGWLVDTLIPDRVWAERMEYAKGWLFILLTTLLLGWLLNRIFREARHSAAQLQLSEERLRVLGDDLPDSYIFQYIIPETNGIPRFTYVSHGVERVHGLTVAEVLRDANCLRGLAVPESRAALAAAEAASARDLADFEQVIWVVNPDGRRRLMYLHSHPRPGEDGRLRWNGIATDITERHQAGEALREAEEKFRQFADNITDVFWMTTPALDAILFVSAGYEKIWGRTLDSLRANPHQWEEAILPAERAHVFAAFLAIKDTGREIDVEYHIQRPDGSIRFIRDRGFPIRNPAGEIIRLAGIAADITDRRQAEENLQAAQARLATALASMSDAVFISDTSGRFVEFNDAFVTFHRFKSREECARTLREYPVFLDVYTAAGELADVSQWAVPRALRGETGTNIEYSLHRRDTGERWVGSYSFAPIRNPDGTIIGSVVSCRDITAGKQAEAALRQSEENFRAMFETASVGMGQADPNTGQWMRVNRKLCEITGYSAAEMLQLKIIEVTHPEDRARDREAFEQVVRGLVPAYRLEKRYIRKDGGIAWVNVNMTVICDRHGHPVRTMATIEDITERKLLAEQFLQAQKMEAIGQLAGGVAHDFNNILGAILGNAELAAMDLDPGSAAGECVARITNATFRARDLVKQILTFSRRQKAERKTIALEPVVEECLRFMRTSMPANVKLSVSLPPGLPAVLADATQMQQVIFNLGTNAWHSLEDRPGSVAISLEDLNLDADAANLLDGLHPGRHLRLTVSDTGLGMDQATQRRIFEPFFTTKPVGQGTGLGLSVVLGIVKEHGGAIQVRSQPGQGTTFEIYLPANTGWKEAAQAAPAHLPPCRNIHVLFLDDEKPMVELARQMFRRLGCRVSGFAHPAEALAAFRQNPAQFDLVFTDFDMPDQSGLAVAAALTALKPGLPVILLSGLFAPETSQAARQAGVVQAIAKPFGIHEIAAVLSRLFPVPDAANPPARHA